MNKKKLLIFLVLIIFIGVIIYFIIQNNNTTQIDEKDNNIEISEYTPQEEISDEQLRQTTITLYYLDVNSNELKTEGLLIDANELLNNPYKVIVQKLIDSPKDSNLKSVFPENTRILDATLKNNCVILNFSEELLNFSDETQKYNIINSILNSITQLTEVNSIKLLVNNEEKDGINEEYSVIN